MISRAVTLLSIVCFLLFVTTIVFIVLYARTHTSRIDPQNCPQIKSTYAVVPNVNPASLKIISQCTGTPDGTEGGLQCSFSGISSLNDAIKVCQSYPNNLCKEFYYNDTNNLFTIIQSGFAVDTSATGTFGDVYISQT